MKRAVLVLFVLFAAASPSVANDATPIMQDPLGPIRDVTNDWQRYQPATTFCVRPNVFEVSGDTGATETGKDPACARSGFRPKDKGLYRVAIETPTLCPGCRRLFIDFSKIPKKNSPPYFYAHGHAYYRLDSQNRGYTVDPKAHSPNTKNFTNDKLFVPDGSPQEPFVHGFDTYAMSYVTDTAYFAHASIQGPYYIGPWYVNRTGTRIHGIYLDVDVTGAEPLPSKELNAIFYRAGFNSGEMTCPDNFLFNGDYRDGNYGYGGCVDHFGFSSKGINPYP